VPQLRQGGFYPEALEKGLSSEPALTMTLAEMYIQGVFTRKVTVILERLCGTSVSYTRVSKTIALLDETLDAWRHRPLSECPYLFLDSRYEKVRQDGQVRDAAVLMACGIDLKDKRQLLGVSASLGEHEIHWRTFLESLVARGLRCVQRITSDSHSGLKAARLAVFGGLPWQRCQFHLQQNASAYVPRRTMLSEVAADIRAIFNAPDRASADTFLQKAMEKYVEPLRNWLPGWK